MGYRAQGFDLDAQFRSYDADTTTITSWRGVQSVQFSDDVPTTGVAPFSYIPRVYPRGWGVDVPAERLRIKHTYGDPGSTYRANRATEVWGTDADVGYGDCPAHVYAPTAADFDAATAVGDPPATSLDFTHTIEIEREDGETVTETRTVTVLNPDHVFQGAATIIVDPDGDFTGAPVDPYGGTYGTATDLPLDSLVANTRYLVRRGKKLVRSSDVIMNDANTDNSFVKLGGWGAGTDWEIETASEEFGLNIKDQGFSSAIVIEDLRITGQWPGDSPDIIKDLAGGAYITAAGAITFHNCTFTGSSVGVRNTGKRNAMTFSNSHITGFQNFGNLMSTSHIYVCIGSVVERHPDSYAGGAGTLGNRGGGPDHGPWRFSSPEPDGRTVITRTSAFSNAGWSMKNRDAVHPLGDGRLPSHQPCVRGNTGGTAGWTYRLSESIFEGGNATMNFGANKNRVRVIDAFVESVVLLGSGNNGGALLGLGHLGVILRNSVLVKPYVEAFESGDGRGALQIIGLGDAGADYGPIREEGYFRAYNNTFVDWSRMDTIEFRKKDSLGVLSDEVIANNLIHAPNRPSTATDLTDLVTLLHGAVPYYKGLKWIDQYNVADGDQPTLTTLSAVFNYFDQNGTRTPNVALPVPNAPIPVQLRRGVTVPFYDFLRNRRPMDGTASKGALEPGATLAD